MMSGKQGMPADFHQCALDRASNNPGLVIKVVSTHSHFCFSFPLLILNNEFEEKQIIFRWGCLETGKAVSFGLAEYVSYHLGHPKVALSTSCSKFPEKLLLFRKVANLNFNHAHID